MILLKDESSKINKANKIKYMFKPVQDSTKGADDFENGFVSFNEISSKIHDKSKSGSDKKKINPYKVDYFKNSADGNPNFR